MTNPIIAVRTVVDEQGRKAGRAAYVLCPGCEIVHSPALPGLDGDVPSRAAVFEWNGSLESPSLLSPLIVYGSVVFQNGARGDCHAIIRDGQWEFYTDSAHRLAGQTVRMLPLPGYLGRTLGPPTRPGEVGEFDPLPPIS